MGFIEEREAIKWNYKYAVQIADKYFIIAYKLEFTEVNAMGNIVGAIVLGVIVIICFVFSYLQFNEKGFLFNNAYIYASTQERKNMDKKLHYKQSGIVFLLIGIIFLINAIDIILQTVWLVYLVIGVVIVAIVYAIVSSVMIEKRKK